MVAVFEEREKCTLFQSNVINVMALPAVIVNNGQKNRVFRQLSNMIIGLCRYATAKDGDTI